MARNIVLLVGILAMLGAVGAGRAARAGAEEGPGEASVSGNREESRSQYLDRIEKEIHELGKKIQELGKSAEAAGGKARIEAKKAVKELEVKKRKLEAEARDLKRSGEKAWRKLRSGVDSALEELKRSVDKVRIKMTAEKGEPT
jgi:hypothetical protein